MREMMKIFKQLGNECIAELIGTLILCGFGNASIAVFILAPQNLSSSLSVHFSWGIGACFGCYVSKSISGGHINPAVTIMKTVFGQFPVYKMIPFIISQTIGAFLSSCLVYLAYIDMELTEENAKIFATYPRDGVTIPQALVTSMIGTALMVHSIFGVNDGKNKSKPQGNLEPLFLGLAVFVYGITFSYNTGYAINPARDLGPRLFIHIIGFPRAFSRGNDTISYYWWIPLLGPVLGAIIGGATYNFLISNIWSCQNVKSIECCIRHELPTVSTAGSEDDEERQKSVINQNIST